MAITHAFVSAKADGADATLVRPSNWNAAHVVTAADIPIVDTAADFTATEVEGALAELQADNEAHVAAADPHTGYVLESATPVTVFVAKTADESVASSTTPQNDDQLLFALAANEEWFVTVVARVDTGGTAAINWTVGVSVPAAATVRWHFQGAYGQTPTTLNIQTATQVATIGTGADYEIVLRFRIKNGANAGNFVLQWAQGTSSVTPIIVRQGSFLEGVKIA